MNELIRWRCWELDVVGCIESCVVCIIKSVCDSRLQGGMKCRLV